MLKFINWVHQLLSDFETYEERRREAYLAESADIYELEYRMRKLDKASSGSPFHASQTAYQDY
ncbi:DUF3563 family protein [Chitinimonas naiadis]